MDKLALTSENVVELWYSFALEKPKPTHSIPQDEWISSIKALSHGKLHPQKALYINPR